MSKEELIKQVETIVFEALGTASMCWSEIPTNIFDSSQASNVGNEAVSNIIKLLSKFKQAEQSVGDSINIKILKDRDLTPEEIERCRKLLFEQPMVFVPDNTDGSDAVEFDTWKIESGWFYDSTSGETHYYKNHHTGKYESTQELYPLFKDEQLKKK